MDPKTLRIAGAGVAMVALVGGGVYFLIRKKEPTKEELGYISPEEKREAKALKQALLEARTPKITVPVRPIDKQILELVPAGITDGQYQKKDVFPKDLAEVDLLRSRNDKATRIRGVRIDLDRDSISDEIWTIEEDGKVERDVGIGRMKSREKWLLEGDSWRLVKGVGFTASAVPVLKPKQEVELRPFDKKILELAETQFTEPLRRDVLPKDPMEITLHKGRHPKVNRVDIDLDRDHKTDERWTFVGQVVRKVSPTDDGKYTEEYELEKDKQKWLRRY